MAKAVKKTAKKLGRAEMVAASATDEGVARVSALLEGADTPEERTRRLVADLRPPRSTDGSVPISTLPAGRVCHIPGCPWISRIKVVKHGPGSCTVEETRMRERDVYARDKKGKALKDENGARKVVGTKLVEVVERHPISLMTMVVPGPHPRAGKPEPEQAAPAPAPEPAPAAPAAKPVPRPSGVEASWPVEVKLPERFIAGMGKVQGLELKDTVQMGKGVSAVFAAQPEGVAALLDYVQPRIPQSDYRYLLVKLARVGVVAEEAAGVHTVAGQLAAPAAKPRRARKKAGAR